MLTIHNGQRPTERAKTSVMVICSFQFRRNKIKAGRGHWFIWIPKYQWLYSPIMYLSINASNSICCPYRHLYSRQVHHSYYRLSFMTLLAPCSCLLTQPIRHYNWSCHLSAYSSLSDTKHEIGSFHVQVSRTGTCLSTGVLIPRSTGMVVTSHLYSSRVRIPDYCCWPKWCYH